MSPENVSIEVNGTGLYALESLGLNAPNFPNYDSEILVGTVWNLDITNLSSSNVSILDIELKAVEPSNGAKMSYSHRYEVLQDTSGNLVPPLLKLEPGETTKVAVEIKFLLHSTAATEAKFESS